MDALGLQLDVFKKKVKERVLNKDSWRHCVIGEQHVLSEGHVMYFIDDSEFYLRDKTLFDKDFNEFQTKEEFTKGTETFIKRMEGYCTEECILTSMYAEIKFLNLKKHKIRVFYCNGSNIYVNDALLKYVDTNKSHYKALDSRHPIIVYEKDKKVGIVMPLLLTESDFIGMDGKRYVPDNL